MYSPLEKFKTAISYLKKRPITFFSQKIQKDIILLLSSAIKKLKSDLEKKSLTKTRAYETLSLLEEDLVSLNDLSFIQHLFSLLDIYHLSKLPKKVNELVSQLEAVSLEAKKGLLNHYILLENLEKIKLSDGKKKINDLEVIQKVGVFYVLEYTLQVLFEITGLEDGQKLQLIEEGLKLKSGSLPAYLPLQKTFKDELCYKIHDKEIRNGLLLSFYDFDDAFYNYKEIGWPAWIKALQKFNISVLKFFKKAGLKKFKGVIYCPYGNELSLAKLILKLSDYEQG